MGGYVADMMGTLTGDVTRSGNTVTVSSVVLNIAWSRQAYGSWSWTFAVGGVSNTQTISPMSWAMPIPNFSLGVNPGDTSAIISWSSSDGYSGSFTIFFPSGASAPQGLGVAFNSSTYNSITTTSTLTSWGSGYSGTPNLEQIICSPEATSSYWENWPRVVKQNATSSLSVTGAINNANKSFYLVADIDIKGCLDYKIAGYASTTAGDTRAYDDTLRHLPPAPVTVTNQNTGVPYNAGHVLVAMIITGGSSSVNYDKEVITQARYSTDGGTTWSAWENAGKGTPWTPVEYDMILPYHTEIKVQAKQIYFGEASEVSTVTFSTRRFPLYGSVDGQSRIVKKLYGPVNGQSKKIKKLYGSVNGKSKLIYEE